MPFHFRCGAYFYDTTFSQVGKALLGKWFVDALRLDRPLWYVMRWLPRHDHIPCATGLLSKACSPWPHAELRLLIDLEGHFRHNDILMLCHVAISLYASHTATPDIKLASYLPLRINLSLVCTPSCLFP
jgi:hypothetical protein